MLLSEYADYNARGISVAKCIVFGILNDLICRGGFDDIWEQINDDVREEILQNCLNIVEREISGKDKGQNWATWQDGAKVGNNQLLVKRLGHNLFEVTMRHNGAIEDEVLVFMPECSWPIGATLSISVEDDLQFDLPSVFMYDMPESRELFAWLRRNS